MPVAPRRRHETSLARPNAAKRRPLAAALVGLLLAACRPSAAPQEPAPGPAEPAPAPAPTIKRDPELVAIADAVDPGAVAPIFSALPPWLGDAFARSAEGETPQALADRARDALARWEIAQESGHAWTSAALTDLAVARYFGERALAAGRGDDPEILATLERGSAVLDARFLTNEKGFFRQVLQFMIDAAAREGLVTGDQRAAELGDFLREGLRRAGPSKRHVAALLLRDHPDHPAVPRVLLDLARDASEAEDYPRAVALSRLALARSPSPTPADLAALAHRCYEALDLDCGDEARAAVVGAPIPAGDADAARRQDERLRSLDTSAADAREVLRLAGSAALTDQLRRGHHLILLGRFADADALYRDLLRAHPRDARPPIGLAKLAIQRDLDFLGAAEYVQKARKLENRDRDVLEVSLGLVTGELLQKVLPQIAAQGKAPAIESLLGPFVADIQADIRAWAAYEPGRAAVLAEIAGAVAEALPHFLTGGTARGTRVLRRLPIRLEALRKKYPEVDDAWRASLVSALFADDRALAMRLVDAPPPAGAADPARDLVHRRAARDIILLWEPDDAAPRLDALVARLPAELQREPDARETRALADGIRALAGDRAAGERAIAAYLALAEGRSAAARTHLIANAATLHAAAGERSPATDAWESALAGADDKTRDFIRLAAAASVPGLEGVFDELATSTASATVRVQAAAWKAESLRRSGADDKAAVDAARAVVRREREVEIRGNSPVGRLGVITSGDFNLNLGYTVREGLTTTFEVKATLWLAPPAPVPAPSSAKK